MYASVFSVSVSMSIFLSRCINCQTHGKKILIFVWLAWIARVPEDHQKQNFITVHIENSEHSSHLDQTRKNLIFLLRSIIDMNHIQKYNEKKKKKQKRTRNSNVRITRKSQRHKLKQLRPNLKWNKLSTKFVSKIWSKIKRTKWSLKSKRYLETENTNIINHDIAEKLLVDKATEDDHLRFADIDGGVATENPKNNNQWRKNLEIFNRRERDRERVSACEVEEGSHRNQRKKLEPSNAYWLLSWFLRCHWSLAKKEEAL